MAINRPTEENVLPQTTSSQINFEIKMSFIEVGLQLLVLSLSPLYLTVSF